MTPRGFDDHTDGKMTMWIEWRSVRRGRSATDGDVSGRVQSLFAKAILAQPIHVVKTTSSFVLHLSRMYMCGHMDWLLHASILRLSIAKPINFMLLALNARYMQPHR
jgi:hypothetical protein